ERTWVHRVVVFASDGVQVEIQRKHSANDGSYYLRTARGLDETGEMDSVASEDDPLGNKGMIKAMPHPAVHAVDGTSSDQRKKRTARHPALASFGTSAGSSSSRTEPSSRLQPHVCGQSRQG
ncbi:hypothetical protein L249_4005, partial [Ophiocordyceps polyrhachis-furcata BCC 54312]